MKGLRYALPLAGFFVLVGFLAVGLNRDPREVPSPLIDKPAPGFALALLDDPAKTITRDDLLGQVWVLNVWASWCGACLQEHPVLTDFARRGKVPVYGLNYKDTRDAGSTWLRRNGNPYRASLFDGDGRVGLDYGVYGAPETFVIDQKGIVRFKHIGPLTPAVIAERIEPLLARLDAS
jgi:cytochrome c biogenesis protein CcmG/thiol:disulfide interchange protein DsbE